MKRSLLSFWIVVTVPVAFFLGQALFPEAALYTRSLPKVAIDWIGAVPKIVFPALTVLWGFEVARSFEPGNPARPAWLLWSFGLLGFFSGQVTLTSYFAFTGNGSVFPSIADLFFVLGSLAVAAALFAFLLAYRKAGFPTGSVRERWLFGLAATALAAAIFVPVLRPVVEAPAPPLEKLLNLAYPALDFLMLLPALGLLRVSLRFWGGRVWPSWFALVTGILFTCAGDILFAYFSGLGQTQLEALIDIAYIAGYGCFAAGALYQRELLLGRSVEPALLASA
ncbi:MAG TPA: hypothetical protein VLQ45_12600 [Thermoanaerobaculia bacterium]|nr:hypothetical protein [Thermoanaerobaculia bacterium]